jgi:hypothetical protein
MTAAPSPSSAAGLRVAVMIRFAAGARTAFTRQCDVLASLVQRHGGIIHQRLVTPAGPAELQVHQWCSRRAFEQFLTDPDRIRSCSEQSEVAVTFEIHDLRGRGTV